MRSLPRALLPTCAIALLCSPAARTSSHPAPCADAWERVWRAVRAPRPPEPVPAAAAQDGPPLREEGGSGRVLFRFRAPEDAARVYLAGSFNGWARNDGGRVSDERFRMLPAGRGGSRCYRWVALSPGVHSYKYVVETRDGKFRWTADPHVVTTDGDGNSTVAVSALDTLAAPVRATPPGGRALKPLPAPREDAAAATLDVRAEKVWVRPDEPNAVRVTVGRELAAPGARLRLRVETPFGEPVHAAAAPCRTGENRLPVPPPGREGGYLARVEVADAAGRVLARGARVLSAVRSVADDLRYGFYATYPAPAGDYDARAASLASLHVNAVEFYDYFPAHGYYAPRETSYHFEPFGTPIDARDVRRKIDAGRRRNILSLAYVAAYAASESVYRRYPHPMTDEKGVPKVFNGGILTEAEADREKKPKWFWLMNVAEGSPWRDYILGEFRRALDDRPGDLVSFDGFEIDTYGDGPDARFYAPGSARSGELLSDVLRDFVGAVRDVTRAEKPHGLVSFNSVNEFGVDRMYDVTDFLFLEIWRSHAERLEDLVDIGFRHRAPRRQRVVLKVYPADMDPKRTAWPAPALRRVLGAAMTGAASLMVAGEPDPAAGAAARGLNTLYYPDHTPLAPGAEDVLRAYNAHDALLLGYAHGPEVYNTDLRPTIPGCVTRVYAAPERRAIVVQLLRVGAEPRWGADVPEAAPDRDREVVLDLPGGVAPRSVHFATPDVPALRTPAPVDFDASGGGLRVLLPDLRVHGTLVLHY